MEKKIASVISYVSHPLLMPMVGLLVISNSGTYAADLDQRFINLIYLATFLLTFMIPVALLPLLYYTGLAGNMQFSERRERLLPLYLTLFFYIAAWFFIRKLPVSQVYQRFMFAACLSVLFVLAISYYWKISAHLVGWGGIIALILVLSYKFGSDMMIFLVLAVLIAGLVGTARLMLNEHKPMQIYSGFLLGFLVVIGVFAL
jgi:hypothetical protein